MSFVVVGSGAEITSCTTVQLTARTSISSLIDPQPEVVPSTTTFAGTGDAPAGDHVTLAD